MPAACELFSKLLAKVKEKEKKDSPVNANMSFLPLPLLPIFSSFHSRDWG